MRDEFLLLFHMVLYNFLSFYPTDATYANLVKSRLAQKVYGRRTTDDNGRQSMATGHLSDSDELKSATAEPLGQFQPNFEHSILG